MKAVLYCRISTSTSFSLDMIRGQQLRLLDYAKENGIEVTGMYLYVGYLGYTLDNPGAQAVGQAVREGKEDLQKIKKGLDCSNSVKNQRDILNYFYETHAEEFESIREYVDDGHTGTDTDQEHFQEMLSDIMSGKIN